MTLRKLMTRLATAASVFLVSASTLVLGTVRASASNSIAGHVLVRVQPGVDAGKLASSLASAILDHASGSDLYSLRVPDALTDADFIAQLTADPRVVFAEPDQYIVSPEVAGEPMHFAFDLKPTSVVYARASTYAQVGFSGAFPLQPTGGPGGSGVVVAVLDTGATFSHPALKGHYLDGYNAIQPDQPPNETADGITNYEMGHGTMVAGIIARLAPQAAILPVRVLNGDGAGTMLNLVKGVRFATIHGARIINMSFGASVRSSALNDALDEAEAAGIVLVASAGNDNNSVAIAPTVSRGTISVAALDAHNKKSSFSSFGSFVRVSAPGVNIESTYWDGGYASWSGTSFSAPFVSAEAALILSARPGLLAESVKSIIRKTAVSVDQQNPSYKGLLGNGIINIDSAVKMAAK